MSSNRAQPPISTVSGVLWCARWLLVLVLIWDQIGSPLHRHHHDSGVDAQWVSAISHLDATLHAEESDHDASLSHAVLVVRTQGERPIGSGAKAGVDIDLLLDAFALKPPSARRLAVAPPENDAPRRTYRSLPPAGRAPPLHT